MINFINSPWPVVICGILTAIAVYLMFTRPKNNDEDE